MVKRNIFKAGTFNVRGLTEEYKQIELTQDLRTYGLDICCLQETKIYEAKDIEIKGNRFINFPSQCKHYGNGFMIAPKWKDRVEKHWSISDRVCVIQFSLDDKEKYVTEQNANNINIRIKRVKKKKLLTIINVYAPTTSRVRENPTELSEMYADIGNIITEVKNKNSSLFLLCGDFNAKIGISDNTESCTGSFSRGIRNNSGQSLIDFCSIHQLFISNSKFKHPARHITTWQNTREIGGRSLTIFNQIDYIICPIDKKHVLLDARSYSGTTVSSDHRLVVCKMEIDLYKLYKPRKAKTNRSFNYSILSTNDQVRQEYKTKVQQKLREHCIDTANWNQIRTSITSAAEEVLGFIKQEKPRNNRQLDREIENLSKEQKELRIKIENCKNTEKRVVMKTRRNNIVHQIKRKLIISKEKYLDNKVEEINKLKDSAKTFKAINMLTRKKFENPFVEDEKGRNVTNPTEIYRIMKNHFQQHFFDETIYKLKAFTGNPEKLDQPITKEEVEKSIKNLNNNRSPGYDNIAVELIKYGPDELHDVIKNILNKALEEHVELDIGVGVLVALQKPGKPKGPVKNLRPVILLPILRKIFSNIVLQRIKPKVDEYLSDSQSAYRQFRSTSDIVWAHRWLTARTQKYNEKIYITGIDMSSAFDTIKREKLIQIYSSFLNADELRMMRLLLANTTLEVRVEDTITEPFESNIGSPQGDGLSGTSFNVYFEYSLRKVREMLNQNSRDEQREEITLPTEAIYADDADFISRDENQQVLIKTRIKDILLEDNLKVNDTKTEVTVLERKSRVKFSCEPSDGINLKITKQDHDEKWRTTRKLGSMLGDSEDISRRKQLSIVALHKLNSIWIRKDKIHEQLRLKLYKALIKPILMYNSGTWGVSRQEENSINAFHRQQLRRILNVKYPAHIGNAQVYLRTKEEPLSLQILTNRWKLFGHTLRLNQNTPAQKAMNHYFKVSKESKFRGRPRTTLPETLNDDIKFTNAQNEMFSRKYNIVELKTIEDLVKLKNIASERESWLNLVQEIYVTAKAEKNFY